MQRLFHKAPDQPLREVPPAELLRWKEAGGWIWFDGQGLDGSEVRHIADIFGLDALSIDDVTDEVVFPKVDEHSRYLFVVLHSVATRGESRIGTSELDLFIGNDFLVTFHRDAIPGIDWAAESARLHDHMAASPAGMAAGIAEVGNRRYLPLIDTLEDRIEGLEGIAVAADPMTLSESQALRRDVIVLRRIMGPQRDVLRNLSQLPSDLMPQPAARAFGSAYDHLFRLVESLDAARSLLAGVVETYRGAIAERTNEVMKVLTVFSAILLPLSLIAGIYGMNFIMIPGADLRWGFVGLAGLMAIFAAGAWLYFARRGFIGGPRLRDLPKAVGLGLVNIGVAPLRVVSRIVTGDLSGNDDDRAL